MFQTFIINDLDNGALTGVKAMPQKDSTSDSQSTFSMGRQVFSNTYTTNIPSVEKFNQKKWIGGNRDASDVTTRNRNNRIGNGSLNSSGALISFTTYKDVNTVNDALTRVRAGGAVAPAKKGASKYNTYVPVPSFRPAIPPNDIRGIKYPTIFH